MQTLNSACQTLCAMPPTCPVDPAPNFPLGLYDPSPIFFSPRCLILIIISSLRACCFHCPEPFDLLYCIFQINVDVTLIGKDSLKLMSFLSAPMISCFIIRHSGLYGNTLLISLFPPHQTIITLKPRALSTH